MSDLSWSETIADIYGKVTTIATVAVNVLPGGKFSFGTEKVRGVDLRVFKSLPPSLGDYYEAFFDKFADRDWLVYEDDRYSFARSKAEYEALGAELMTSFGVKPGDRVGIAMRNYPELLISFIGITAAGGVAVPLNAMWKGEELEYAIADADCKVVICDPERMELCAPFQSKVGFKTILVRGEVDSTPAAVATGAAAWGAVINVGSTLPKPSRSSINAEDEAMIMYTSGSTGAFAFVTIKHASSTLE
jgi:long-chain acyl-CoA synthetase